LVGGQIIGVAALKTRLAILSIIEHGLHNRNKCQYSFLAKLTYILPSVNFVPSLKIRWRIGFMYLRQECKHPAPFGARHVAHDGLQCLLQVVGVFGLVAIVVDVRIRLKVTLVSVVVVLTDEPLTAQFAVEPNDVGIDLRL
jgi:hypothetical protein